MMYPRLKLARNLLTDDGTIFVSISDHEVDNLRKLLNEVFGESNYVGQIAVSKGTTTGQDANDIGSIRSMNRTWRASTRKTNAGAIRSCSFERLAPTTAAKTAQTSSTRSKHLTVLRSIRSAQAGMTAVGASLWPSRVVRVTGHPGFETMADHWLRSAQRSSELHGLSSLPRPSAEPEKRLLAASKRIDRTLALRQLGVDLFQAVRTRLPSDHHKLAARRLILGEQFHQLVTLQLQLREAHLNGALVLNLF